MANSKKKCTFCKEYRPAGDVIKLPAGFFCDMNHAIKYANAKQLKASKIKVKAKAKQERAENRKAREGIKTKSKWLSELQAIFNKYVRLRDAALGCVSCDKPSDWQGQWHASHYYSRGHSSSLRFNLWNVHKSCSVCNNHLSGNIVEYTPEIIRRIGQSKFDYLLSNKGNVAKYDIDWIKRAIKITRKRVRTLEKQRIGE